MVSLLLFLASHNRIKTMKRKANQLQFNEQSFCTSWGAFINTAISFAPVRAEAYAPNLLHGNENAAFSLAEGERHLIILDSDRPFLVPAFAVGVEDEPPGFRDAAP